jgi:uncharacterized protein
VSANEKHKILALAFSTFYQFDKLFRVHRAARWIKKNFSRRRMFCKQIKTRGHDFTHLARGITPRAFHKLGRHTAGVLVSRFANEINEQPDSLTIRDGAGPVNFLISGATGFVGSRLAQHLIARGDLLHYLARKPSDKLPPTAVFHHGDIQTPPGLTGLPVIDAAVHLVGEPVNQRWTEQTKRRIHSSRVDGTRNLVKALATLDPKPAVFVSASAIGYYGDRGDETLTEDKGPGDNFLAKVCVDWEREAQVAAEFGIRTVRIRIAAVLGPEAGAFPLMKRPASLGLGAAFGNGRQWMSWIHVEDLVRLIVFAVENPMLVGPVNGASPEPVTNAAFTKALGHALHRPAFLSVPKFALRLMLGEMVEFLFDSLRVIPAAAMQAGFEFRFGRLTTALEDLVRQPSP